MKMRYLLALLLILFSAALRAEEAADILLAEAPINQSDMASIKRGAKFFASNCMACHTMIYLRYDPIAQEAGITYEKMPINVVSWPNGITPPDLSSEADIRGVNWIYTYLHSFYQDPSRPTGSNNLLVPNSGMTNVLAAYQGTQDLISNKPQNGILYNDLEWYDLVKLVKQGSMAPEEFDAITADVVNFLAYAAEPYKQKQEKIGWWVLGFLAILFCFMVALKREYWKDVKKYKNE